MTWGPRTLIRTVRPLATNFIASSLTPFVALLGLLVGLLLYERLFIWMAFLWATYAEYRTALTYPHLRRRRSLVVFVPLTLLHSGPWLLALVIFGAFHLYTSQREEWHYWMVAGFLGGLAVMGAATWSAWKKRRLIAASGR